MAKFAKIQKTFMVLDLNITELLPTHFNEAMKNALKLEKQHQSFRKILKENPWLDDRDFMAAFKAACPTRRTRTHRITFGTVTAGRVVDHIVDESVKTLEVKIEGEEKKMKFTTSPKEIPSGPILEKFPGSPQEQKYGVLHLMMYNKELWSRLIGGTRQSFIRECAKANLPVDIVIADLKMLYKKYFRKLCTAILGYRSSWKFKPFYSEQVWSKSRGWIQSGRKLAISTNLRFYLISIIKDPEIAAISIQTAWRRKCAIKSTKLIWQQAILCELEKAGF